MAIFGLVSAAILTLALGSFSIDQRRGRLWQAQELAQAGLEAARSIRNFRFTDLLVGSHGLSASGGYWAWSGSTETIGDYTREISIGPVYRDGRHGDIVSAGAPTAILDPWSRRVTSTVSWLGELGLSQSVELASVFTRWGIRRYQQDSVADFTAARRNSTQVTAVGDGEVRLSAFGDWASASVLRSIDIAGNENPVDCAVDAAADLLYISTDARGGGQPEFFAYDVSDVTPTTTPLFTVKNAETGEDSKALAVNAGFAYLATAHNSQELMVVRIADGALLASWNTPSTGANANDVYATGTTAYLVTQAAGGGQPEFFVVDITVPASIPATPLGVAEIGENINAVTVAPDRSHAYLATDANSEELMVVRLSDYQVVQRIDVGGNANATDVAVVGNRLYLVKRSDSSAELYVFDATAPGAIVSSPLSSVELNRNALHLDVHGGIAFVTTDDGSAELVAVDLSSLVTTAVNLPGTATADSVCGFGAYAYVVSRANSTEVMVVQGGLSATGFAPEGSLTSFGFDSGSATTVWDSLEWSRSGTGTLQLLLRTASTAGNLPAAGWAGPDGSAATRYTVPGEAIMLAPASSGSRWLQLKAFLSATTTAVTPVLEDVTLYYDQ